ncbi:MAG: PEP/pyruvate-binding domain-containing protein [Anaerolineae bacterium]
MKTLPKLLTPLLTALLTARAATGAAAQSDTPVTRYFVDAAGRARLQVASTPESYYVLFARDTLPDGPEHAVAMALGQEGTTTLTEGLAAYPQAHYRVARYPLAAPGDQDGDGIDDVAELQGIGRLAPFNPSAEIQPVDGTVAIPDRATFETLSYQGEEVLIDGHLKDLEFVKFYILDANTPNPKVYFMNTVTHRAHGSFARAIGIPGGMGGGGRPGGGRVPGQMRGEIVYHPQVVAPDGRLGVYRFEFEPNDNYPFADVRMAYELFARNMPLLENNWFYYPMPNAALPRYRQEKALFDASRVQIILDEAILGNTRYIPLNLAEGYGMLTVMDPTERPNPRDVVIYAALPNEMPRVAGIITTVPQTPLSHVNLRAIQDGVPNAYIAGALADAAIAGLVGKHVFYKVSQGGYVLREASLAEVEAYHAARRPAEPQIPTRDLGAAGIVDLDDIGFADWPRFGVKASNVAAMRRFGFPEGTIPDGFAVPFAFYDAFMTHNGFYDDVRSMLADPSFQSDYDVQEARLADLRDRIEKGDMPQAMLDALAAMQATFPAGRSIRCRSSTNNEDLPGFSGAGLYDSFTHRPDEGHIAKSIKQVYASTWTFRAFDERQYYRIDHFRTAMGVLVHANYDDEQANGVGVTTDPIYRSTGTYYLNTQLGENLVTNPDALSIPEEILLGAAEGSGYTLVRPSNQVPEGRQLLSNANLEAMRRYLGVIQARFQDLYGQQSNPNFHMEIEYKIAADADLEIKQARPWHSDTAATDPGVATPTPARTAAQPTTRPTAIPTTPSTPPPGARATLWLPRVLNR